jgi:hypothetical protein
MHSIQNYLEKKEPSLDAAFKLKVKGRPTTLTPNREQEIVEAYLDVVRASGQIDLTKETLQKAESAAFKALYGKTPEELRGSRSHHSKAIGIKANHNLHDFGSVDDGLTRIRRVLKKYNALLK